MKKWKKCLCSFVALLFLISLTACDTNPSGTTVAIRPSGTPAVTDDAEEPVQLPTEGWRNVNSSTPDRYAFGSDGCYFTYKSCLCFLDTATGYTAFLCSRPACPHGEAETGKEREQCDAYVGIDIIMMFCYNETLYYAALEEFGTQLYARDLDGTNMRKIAILGSDYITQNTSHHMSDWSVCGNYLYYTAYVDSFEISGESYTQTGKAVFILSRLNLANGQEAELLRTDKEVIRMLRVNDGLVLLKTQENFDIDVDLGHLDQIPFKLCLWSEEIGGVVTLCELDKEKQGSTVGITKGQLHFRDAERGVLSAYDFTTGELGDSNLPENVTMIWNESYSGVYLDGYYHMESGEYKESVYGKMTLPEGIHKFGVEFVCIGDKGIIFREFYYNENANLAIDGYSIYVYVPYSKMDDGLQLSDRMIFMRRDDNDYQLIQPES